MLSEKVTHLEAVEPSDNMRAEGMAFVPNVKWHSASAEATGLIDNSFDFVSMASSFHWPDYDKAINEFYRILKPGGLFIALWNPRRIESNPVLIDIEKKLYELKPSMQRKSSGRSEFCNTLQERLLATDCVEDVVYVEGIHTEFQPREAYLGLWNSVNDIQVQLGPEKFTEFLNYICTKIKESDTIEAQYTTRAWIARMKK